MAYIRKTPKKTVVINETIDSVVQWKKLIRAAYKLALGGGETVNQYGTKVVARPDINAIRFLTEMRFGRADTRITDSRADTELLESLKVFANRYVLPSKDTVSVDDKGELVEETKV